MSLAQSSARVRARAACAIAEPRLCPPLHVGSDSFRCHRCRASPHSTGCSRATRLNRRRCSCLQTAQTAACGNPTTNTSLSGVSAAVSDVALAAEYDALYDERQRLAGEEDDAGTRRSGAPPRRCHACAWDACRGGVATRAPRADSLGAQQLAVGWEDKL